MFGWDLGTRASSTHPEDDVDGGGAGGVRGINGPIRGEIERREEGKQRNCWGEGRADTDKLALLPKSISFYPLPLPLFFLSFFPFLFLFSVRCTSNRRLVIPCPFLFIASSRVIHPKFLDGENG